MVEKDIRQSLMGLQMAFAYAGATFMPLLFGQLAEETSIYVYPAFLAVLSVMLAASTEWGDRLLGKNHI